MLRYVQYLYQNDPFRWTNYLSAIWTQVQRSQLTLSWAAEFEATKMMLAG